jgi:peptidoglycan/LPS O-acetylase OafA/YrhL
MRVTALDSLRGLAAVTVIAFHVLISLPGGTALVEPLDYASYDVQAALLLPLRALWMGEEAVILFFLLSAFVLTGPFLRQPEPAYGSYVLKRLVRLFPPAIVSVLLSITLLTIAGTSPSVWPMPLLDRLWRELPSVGAALQHMLLLGDGAAGEVNYPLNLPLWTLEVEWRLSLLLPFMVLLARRSSIALIAVALGAILVPYVERRLLGSDLLSASRYVPLFAVGVLLARHIDAILAWIASLPGSARISLWALCILLFYVRVLLPTPTMQAHHRLVVGIAAALLIALVLSSKRAQRFLDFQPLLWFGRVSFSLYLMHVPIMIATARLLPDSVTPSWRLAIAIGLSLAAAEVMYRSVELPSIDAARRVSRWARERPARQQPLASQAE